jgi:hypothetical protein
MSDKHIYISIPHNNIQLVIRAPSDDAGTTAELLSILANADLQVVDPHTYKVVEPLEVSKWECISESHVRWEKQVHFNVQRTFNYKYSEWVAAGSPLKVEEEAEPCAN